MKKFGIYSMAVLMLGIGTMSTGCMGSWIVTKKIYAWNEKVTGNKYINNVIFWVLGWIVYPVTIFIDSVVLNLIEFWTGSNPMALGPNDKETQIVKGKDGNSYEITATQNRFDIKQLSGEKIGNAYAIVMNPTLQSCTVMQNGQLVGTSTFDALHNNITLVSSDGAQTTFPANTELSAAAQLMANATSDIAMAK